MVWSINILPILTLDGVLKRLKTRRIQRYLPAGLKSDLSGVESGSNIDQNAPIIFNIPKVRAVPVQPQTTRNHLPPCFLEIGLTVAQKSSQSGIDQKFRSRITRALSPPHRLFYRPWRTPQTCSNALNCLDDQRLSPLNGDTAARGHPLGVPLYLKNCGSRGEFCAL